MKAQVKKTCARGDLTLSDSRFNSIVNYAQNYAGACGVNARSVCLSNGQEGFARTINFYNSKEYALALGRATLIYDRGDNPVGFYDEYNFDPKVWGVRSYSNEIKTRAVNYSSYFSNASTYIIKYGIQIEF